MKNESNIEYKKIAESIHGPLSNFLLKQGRLLLGKNRPKEIRFDGKEVHTNLDLTIENSLVKFINQNWPDKYDIVTEEKSLKLINKKYCFFIDPIDGTRNFVAGNPLFAISIGLWDLEKSQPLLGLVYIPKLDELYSWHYGNDPKLNGNKINTSSTSHIKQSIVAISFLRNKTEYVSNWDRMSKLYSILAQNVYGFRTLQCDSISLCWVASGQLDGAFLPAARSFDFAGGLAILLGAGGKAINLLNKDKLINSQDNSFNLLASNQLLFAEAKQLLK